MRLTQGTLWQRLVSVSETALQSGALVPIATNSATIEDGSGVRFTVRILDSLRRKDAARKQHKPVSGASPSSNPFLPPDPDLTVGGIGKDHTAVLNKFNVVDNHLLVVTNHFEEQEMLLNVEDFAALWFCLGEYSALGFYNGGREAGASQPHKHLQLVPLPLIPGCDTVPIAPLLPQSPANLPLATASLPFRHGYVRLSVDSLVPQLASLQLFELYSRLLQQLGMDAATPTQPRRQSGPYCLLITRDWMLLVPRTREFYEDISLNTLAFAGSFFVRNEGEYEVLKATGPMNALRAVAVP